MVYGVDGVYGNELLSSLGLFNSKTQATDTQGNVFDNILNEAQSDKENIGHITNNDSSLNPSDTNSNSDMDLNNDGTVTIDEVLRYMTMQQLEKLSDSSQTKENSVDQSENLFNLFKSKNATNAYQSNINGVEGFTSSLSFAL